MSKYYLSILTLVPYFPLSIFYQCIEFLKTLETTFIETYSFFAGHQREISCMEFTSFFWLIDPFSLLFFSGPRKIRVKLAEPEMVGPHSLFTKFRVQWSKLDSFNVVHGDSVVFCSSNEGRAMECIINGKKILILRELPKMTSNLFRSFLTLPSYLIRLFLP